jgi:hypothetical protein
MKMKEKSSIIVNYFKVKIKNLLIQKKWYNIIQKLKNKNIINNIIPRIKYYFVFNKITKVVKKQITKISFRKIYKIQYINISINKIKINIERINNKNNITLLQKYLAKWKDITSKKITKENKLKNSMNILNYHFINESIYNINNIFIYKKISNFVAKTETLFNKNQQLYDTTAKSKFMKNIYDLYKFKILNQFSNYYDDLIRKRQFIFMIKFFFNLKSDNINKKDYNYSNIICDEVNASKKINIKFHCSIKNVTKDMINNNYKKTRYIFLISSFINYINKKIDNRKKYAFNKLKEIFCSFKFIENYNNFSKKIILSNKKVLIKCLNNKNISNIKKAEFSKKLFVFFRKSIIYKVSKSLKSQRQFTKLKNVIKLTVSHKNVAKNIFLLKIIKKWRFLTFLNIMFSKKMSLMYNDLHSGYLDLVKSIVDDTPLKKSDVDKMSRLDIKRYLNNYEDPFIVKDKNEINHENEKKFYFSTFKKDNNAKNERCDIYSSMDDDFNRENNVGDSMEKSISFMEKKFIKDNVNYLYNSYESLSDFDGKK